MYKTNIQSYRYTLRNLFKMLFSPFLFSVWKGLVHKVGNATLLSLDWRDSFAMMRASGWWRITQIVRWSCGKSTVVMTLNETKERFMSKQESKLNKIFQITMNVSTIYVFITYFCFWFCNDTNFLQNGSLALMHLSNIKRIIQMW